MSIFALAAVWQPAASSAAPSAITVFPASPVTGNCYPFGVGGGGFAWTPYAGFVYKNIPAFELKPGDALAFDTAGIGTNDVNVQLEIALARTATNGGDAAAQPFTTVVNNTQTPLNPRGDTTQGNFDLQFTAQAPFSFPGGGLIIRFANPSATYATDVTCNGNLVAGSSSDSSGFFVKRFFNDADGGDPWVTSDTGDIGAFRLVLANASPLGGGFPSNALTFGKVTRDKDKGTAILPVTVPGPGTLVLAGKRINSQRLGRGATASRAVSSAGVVNLKIKARGDFRKKLKADGKLVVRAKVTYTPSGGTQPNTQTKRVKLIKR